MKDAMFDYIRNGQDIYDRSFSIIRSATDLSSIPPDMEKVVVRIIHACGMIDIVKDMAFSDGAGRIGRQALVTGAPILCDARMVADGVTQKRLPVNNQVICSLGDPSVPEIAQKLDTTRSAAALELWRPQLKNSVVAIGNAPTALFRLLEMIEEGASRPALILGFPVGFVGAAESKDALIENRFNIPFVTVRGRRGGSAMVAAAVNALASEQE